MEFGSALARLFRQPVLWLLVYGTLIAYGIHALLNIPVEVLPRFDLPRISVVAHVPGMTAEDVESLLARPLEGEIMDLPGLASLRATLSQGTLQLDARFVAGSDARQDLQAVNSAIDRAQPKLPAGVRPLAEIMGNAINEVADYAVHLPPDIAPAVVQRRIETNILPALRAVPGVQRVELFGAGDEALWIQPRLAQMRHYGATVPDILAGVRRQVLLSPGGYVTLGHQDVPIEALNLPLQAKALDRAPIRTRHGDVPLYSLARVVRSATPIHMAVSLDGRPTLMLTVFKQPDASTLPVTTGVSRTLDALAGQLPAGVHWQRIYDQGHLVGIVRNDLSRNLVAGGLLAIALLFWILGAGRGVGVLALSIPLSLLIGIAGLYALGQSLNLMTLGALTVAVGLLADDAIIVLESIYHRWEAGFAGWDGVRQGLRDIAGPDLTGTLTTIFVFLPLLFVGGLAGLFFRPFALAMIVALLASLLISLTLVPLVLGSLRARPHPRPTRAGQALEWLRRRNERLLDWALHRPKASLGIGAGLLLLSLLGLALVPIHFLPLPNEGVILESFSTPPGTSLRDTQAAVVAVVHRLLKDPAVAHVLVRTGSASRTAYTEPSHAGEIQIVLTQAVANNSLDALGQRLLRESQATGIQFSQDTPTVERVGESLSGLPQPFVVRLFGNDLSTLRRLSEQVAHRLRGVRLLSDVFDNDAYPVTQLRIRPRPDALALDGLTPAALAEQVDPLLAGKVVAKVPDGNAPLDLYFRLPDVQDLTPDDLRRLPVLGNGWSQLGELADLRLVVTPNQFHHLDGSRMIEIMATPLGPLGSTVAAAKSALSGLHLPKGYRIGFGGLLPQLQGAALALGLAAIAALVLIVGILILQFGSWQIPGLLLLQMPLAFTGGAIALTASGVGLNAVGLVAFLTLIGISLNHGIVLLHRARRSEAAGTPLEQAVREAVRIRFRPIVLTTLTAALGMLPTALGWGRGAAPEQGLAIVSLGGLIWSALLSTNLLPALYLRWQQKQSATRSPDSTGQ